MSELLNRRSHGHDFRWHFLGTVSAIALIASARGASADNTDRPTLWIELGGQAERMEGVSTVFSPPFVGIAPAADIAAMTGSQKPPSFSIGEEAKISFMPEGTDWVLSASVRYGRSGAARHLHHQTPIAGFHYTALGRSKYQVPSKVVFGEGQSGFEESHAILDFQAGKDVGLGLFGARGSSVFSAGVRFAQFTAQSHVTLHARPAHNFGPPLTFPGLYKGFRLPTFYATNTAFAHSSRSAHAVGPSISWDASQPVAGNGSDMTFNFDWGLKAAILFGRQHARVHHQTTGNSLHLTGKALGYTKYATNYTHTHPDQDRARSVTIPNVGGFVGVSLKFPNAKISLGYRADFFFGAMDAGNDVRKTETVGFYGPFALISVGLGG